jgi:hemolysin III
MADTHTYTKNEEIVNAIIHGLGAVLSAAALVLLIVFSSLYGSAWHIVSFTVYGITMLILYISSTLVHSFPEGKVKDLFEVFDHASIYWFIAGTYTPISLTVIKGSMGWTLFGLVWGMALVGTVFKIFYAKKFLFLSTLLYAIMGWLVVIAWKPLAHSLPSGGLALLIAGGLAYTFGTVFYVWRGFLYHHAVWHMFVLTGSILHFFSVILYVLPRA